MSELALDLFNALSKINKLQAHITKLEAFIEQLIEASENMSYAVQCKDDRDAESYFAWKNLVSEWRRINGSEK